MKKAVLSSVVAAVLASAAGAASVNIGGVDVAFYGGVNVEYAQSTFKMSETAKDPAYSADDFSHSFKGGAFSIGVEGGAKFGSGYNAHRVYVGISQQFNAKDNFAETYTTTYTNSGVTTTDTDTTDLHLKWKQTKFALGYDYNPRFSELVGGFVGAYVGFASGKLDVGGTYTWDLSSTSGYVDTGSEAITARSFSSTKFIWGVRAGVGFTLTAQHAVEVGVRYEAGGFDIDDPDCTYDNDLSNLGVFVGYRFNF